MSLLAFLVLAFYPARLVAHTVTQLLTIVVCTANLFVPMRFLLIALLPDVTPEKADRGMPLTWWRSGYGLGLVAIVGISIGAGFFAAEMTEGIGGIRGIGGLALVAAVYVGLATAGLLIAYALVSGPLGLSRRG